MSIDVRVPTTGNAGEDAVISDWNVAVGDRVSAGDVIVVLETAKASLEVEAPISGEVLKLLYEEGDEVPEHEVLAILGEPGEKPGDGPVEGVAATFDDEGGTAPAYPTPGVVVHDQPEDVAPSHSEDRGRISASPKARKIAATRGIELRTLTGSGPGGRIVIADVLAAPKNHGEAPVRPTAAAAAPPAEPGPASTFSPAPTAEFTLVPVRGARKVTAQRMHQSLTSTAQVTLTRYAKADALLAYIARLRNVTEAAGLPRIGVNDALLFATARTVAKHPEANSWFDWDGIRQFSGVNMGFARRHRAGTARSGDSERPLAAARSAGARGQGGDREGAGREAHRG